MKGSSCWRRPRHFACSPAAISVASVSRWLLCRRSSPVNYRLIDGCIVFRSSRGSKLSAAASGAVVAFEVDDYNAADRSGWSVLVVGPSEVVHDLDVTFKTLEAGLQPYVDGPRGAIIRIEPRSCPVAASSTCPPVTSPVQLSSDVRPRRLIQRPGSTSPCARDAGERSRTLQRRRRDRSGGTRSNRHR